YLQSFDRREASRRFAGFAHRFHKTPDLVALFACLARAIREHGSLGALFQACYDPRDEDIAPSLARFVEALRVDGLEYLLTSPNDKSACKRMNLYLRWMVRRTPPDLGLWTFVDPAKLVMPVDTHIHRIATFLGLNQRKSADWKAAREPRGDRALRRRRSRALRLRPLPPRHPRPLQPQAAEGTLRGLFAQRRVPHVARLAVILSRVRRRRMSEC
ncbi:MAG TPA: DUF2400 family protein, partial [Vicinamibacterales bacterium]|nr:DUF2400 family protein [Vicinamibacterales bacterium]